MGTGDQAGSDWRWLVSHTGQSVRAAGLTAKPVDAAGLVPGRRDREVIFFKRVVASSLKFLSFLPGRPALGKLPFSNLSGVWVIESSKPFRFVRK